MAAPLAERLRPKTYDDVIGQQKLMAPDGALRSLLEKGLVPSMILWGPPGVGKTTLAEIIARESKRAFYTLSAISSGVKDVREVIQKAQNQGVFSQGKAAILFIDEIHRFSKSQQDSLLGAVERGVITLIGATTENPSFEVIAALLSRCQVYTLEALNADQLEALLERAVKEDDLLREKELNWKEREAIIRYSGGDARKLLNNVELIANQLSKGATVDNVTVEKVLQQTMARYDKAGEQHYDIISAFIKSIRGSDPNAGLYWLARMIEGGEKPAFIARRLLILASEDIGLANPNALLLANSTFDAVQKIGWPESRIILAECVVYLANAPKSNSAYEGINKAQNLVKETGNLSVPLPLRNAPTKLMKELGYGQAYAYSHEGQQNFIAQEFMPETLEGRTLYQPGDNPTENKAYEAQKKRWGEKYDQGKGSSGRD
ncbi:MAG: replication-associated recombination protein A [Schleiferiaceae bacterium]|nr:replication-associated recombination protein A [Schleiferiaceae bacterium]MDR9442415.1 replication-associated recombination protein A [Schleiferiaceae bacterium]